MARLIEDANENLSYEEHPTHGLQVKTGILLIVLLLFFNFRGVASEKIVVGGLDGVGRHENFQHPPVLLALSGGGARGLAAIGVLKAFEERNIPIAAIAGTSMGGIIGGLYASGYSAEELETIVRNIEFSELFAKRPSRSTMFLSQRKEKERHLISLRFDGFRPRIPKALTDAQRLTTLLTDLTSRANYLADGDFTNLPIPFLTLGTDLITGEEVIMDSGSLADAMRATMAFPLAFTEIEYGHHLLMDGGMLRPIPVELARKLAASVRIFADDTFVVAVNTTSPLRDKEFLVTPLDIASQVTSIMTADKLHHDLEYADYVISPLLTEISSSDFSQKDSIIAWGYRAGISAADSIIQLRKPTMRAEHLTPVGGNIVGINVPFEGSIFDRTMSRFDLTNRMKQFALKHNLFRLEAILDPAQMTDVGPANGATRIEIYLNAELAPVVADLEIMFVGNSSFDDSTLLRVSDFNDSLLMPLNLQRALENIRLHYRDKGFDLVDISDVRIDFDKQEITIEINEGLIQRIDISNNRHTRDWLVRSFFPMKVGQPYSTTRASHGIASIYGTDLFDRVTLGLRRGVKGVIVDIKVEERAYLQTRLGWHWDDQYDSEEFFEILTDNAHGIGLEYLAHASYGQNRQKYFAGIKADRIFSSYVTAGLRIYHNRINRTTYGLDDLADGIREERKTGGYFTAGQQISRLGSVEGEILFEHVSHKDSRFSGKNSFDLRTISFRSEVERFDRVPFTRKGERYIAQVDFTGKLFGGDIEYTRLFASVEAYFPLGKLLNYHPKISVGSSRRGLPPSEQFFIGGLHSFSGFRTHQLAGDKLLLFNQEFRLRLPLRLYLTTRYDIGEVYAGADQIKLRNLRHGFGISFSLDTPLGPFELGYGISGSDNERVYFRAGHSF